MYLSKYSINLPSIRLYGNALGNLLLNTKNIPHCNKNKNTKMLFLSKHIHYVEPLLNSFIDFEHNNSNLYRYTITCISVFKNEITPTRIKR